MGAGTWQAAGYGEVSSAWANRVQPANSKGGNWWQSPLCGASPPSVLLRGPTHVGLVAGARRCHLELPIECSRMQPIGQAIPRPRLSSVRFEDHLVRGWERQVIADCVALRIEI